MSETWKGATRQEFVDRARGFSKREIVAMMRDEQKQAPLMPEKSTLEDFLGACFDVLTGQARGSEPSTRSAPPPSKGARVGVLRYEIRSWGRPFRWRCGHRFTNAPERFAVDAFSKAELAELEADPYIQVTDLTRRK